MVFHMKQTLWKIPNNPSCLVMTNGDGVSIHVESEGWFMVGVSERSAFEQVWPEWSNWEFA